MATGVVQQKTYAMLLKELCDKEKMGIPQFNQVEISKTPPLFVTTCEFTFQGKLYKVEVESRNKSEGKQRACESLIKDHLKISMADPEAMKALRPLKQDEFGSGKSVVEAGKVKPSELTDAVINGNPIGDLKSYCAQANLPEPKYSEKSRSGPSNDPLFVMQCEVGTLKFEGCWSKIQVAKKTAADKVLSALRIRQLNNENLGNSGPSIFTESSPMEEGDNAGMNGEARRDGASAGGMPFRNLDGNTGLVYVRDKTIRLGNEFMKLGLGTELTKPRYKDLTTIGSEVNNKFPMDAKPLVPMREWLDTRKETAMEFLMGLKEELGLTENWIITKAGAGVGKRVTRGSDGEESDGQVNGVEESEGRPEPKKYMVCLNVQIPGVNESRPTAVNFCDTVEDGKETVALEILTFIALMSIP